MLIKSKGLTRRGLLALGGGAAIAPFVPMLSSTSRAATGSPCRLLIFQMGHGLAWYNTKPQGTESDWDLTQVLQPLADFKDRLVYLGGIDNPAGLNPVQIKHVDCFKTLLTGTDQTAGDKTASISIDQLIANEIGDQTAFPSLLSGVHTDARGVSASGYEQELSAETSPAEQFDRLFSDLDLDDGALDKLKADRGSVLDAVQKNLEAIENRVSTEDKIKIERHLDAVRTMEEDLANLGLVPGGCAIPDDSGVGAGGDYQAVGRAHMDVLATAFACDLTRVSVLNWATGNGIILDYAGIQYGWHECSHQGSTASKDLAPELTAASTWKMGELAYLLSKLDEYQDAEGSVLDNTLVVGLPFLRAGHDVDDLPVVLTGGAAGQLVGDRFIEYGGRSTNDLWVTVAQMMGIDIDTFGAPDLCDGALPGLVG